MEMFLSNRYCVEPHGRMEAALAEFRAEELGQDAEDDADFVVVKGSILCELFNMTR